MQWMAFCSEHAGVVLLQPLCLAGLAVLACCRMLFQSNCVSVAADSMFLLCTLRHCRSNVVTEDLANMFTKKASPAKRKPA
jgi:hypothetical protein